MKILLTIIYLTCFTLVGFAASINVDELSIIADGNYSTTSNKFEMNTYFKFVTSFDGGYKFAARVAFETSIKQLEYNYTTNPMGFVYLFFHNAEVTAKDLVDSHLDLSFWTGTHRYLGDGNRYRGYLYYPDSNDTDYRGFYRLRGTGMTAAIKFWEEKFKASFHLYQNSNFVGPTVADLNMNFFSFDSEVGLYFDKVKVGLFGGYTKDFIFPNTSAQLEYGRGKLGVDFWIGNEYIDFYSCVGFASMDSTTFNNIASGSSNFFDLLYLVGELNFKLFLSTNTISFLTRPALFNEKATGAATNFDINYKFKIAVPDFPLNGGFQFNLQYSTADPADQWKIILAPYASITFSGVIWTLTTHYDFGRLILVNNTGDGLHALEGLKIVIGASSKF